MFRQILPLAGAKWQEIATQSMFIMADWKLCALSIPIPLATVGSAGHRKSAAARERILTNFGTWREQSGRRRQLRVCLSQPADHHCCITIHRPHATADSAGSMWTALGIKGLPHIGTFSFTSFLLLRSSSLSSPVFATSVCFRQRVRSRHAARRVASLVRRPGSPSASLVPRHPPSRILQGTLVSILTFWVWKNFQIYLRQKCNYLQS